MESGVRAKDGKHGIDVSVSNPMSASENLPGFVKYMFFSMLAISIGTPRNEVWPV